MTTTVTTHPLIRVHAKDGYISWDKITVHAQGDQVTSFDVSVVKVRGPLNGPRDVDFSSTTPGDIIALYYGTSDVQAILRELYSKGYRDVMERR